MFRSLKNTAQRLSGTDPVYFCLFLALGLVFLLIAVNGYSHYFLNSYAMIPVMLFWGILITRRHSPDTLRHLVLGLAVAAWFVICQTLQYAADLTPRSSGLFFLVYLMAFPFASAAQDAGPQTGLKMAGIAYIGGTLVLAAFSGLLMLDALPGFLEPHVVWDGARLSVMWHPNVCACVFMIATAFCLYFFSGARRTWHKIVFLAVAAILFALIALTNSRTGILLTCCLLGGFVFFSIWKGGWKRFVIGGIAAAATIVVLFLISQALFSFHENQLIQRELSRQEAIQQDSTQQDSTQQETNPPETVQSVPPSNLIINEQTGEISLRTEAAQGSLLHDLGTLNSRTWIWRAAAQAAISNPTVLLRGTDNSAQLIAGYYLYPVYSHNSYLEILISLGIPGLIFAVLFSLTALWNIACVLLRKTYSMQHKTIALLMICLLAAGILEAYLFQGSLEFLYTDFVFFLSLGYLIQWKRA